MVSYRPTVAEINLRALDFNIGQIRRLARGRKILAVVKADAYGHGAVPVAARLQSIGVEYFGVALVEEALELREAGIRRPICVMCGIFPGQEKDIVKADLTPFLFDLRMARGLNREAQRQGRRVKVHIKVDTGMGRIGVAPTRLEEFLITLKGLKGLKVEGIGSHFSESYKDDREFSFVQIRRFEEALQKAAAMGFSLPLRHIANSAGLASIPESLYTLVRPGILLYGGFPSPEYRTTMAERRGRLGPLAAEHCKGSGEDKSQGGSIERAERATTIRVKPAMSLKTRVLFLKEVPSGFPVSYGRTFVTARKSLIATIPIGYGDGYPRKLSNRGTVLIRGKRAPIVGRVCMDLTMVDVTDIRGVRQGDEVVLLGRQGREEISSDDLAEWAETVPYEIFTGIGKRVPRVYRKS